MDRSIQDRTGTRLLKASELVVLQIVDAHSAGNDGTAMIVGDIQRAMEILPAQMSRLLRSLEGTEPPLIQCRRNSLDKRRVDVYLTAAGRKSLRSTNAAMRRQAIALLMSLRYPPMPIEADTFAALEELLTEIQRQCPQLELTFRNTTS